MNRDSSMTCRHALAAILIATVAWSGRADDSSTSSARGSVKSTLIHSAVLGRNVAIHVWLPPGYDAPANAARRYPVIYLLDGSAMFDATARTPGTGLHLDSSLDRLVGEGKIEPIIAVAIEENKTNPASESRRLEYTPYRDPFFAPGGPEPEGKRFPEFLTTEVLPKIAALYRVTDDPKKTGIGGFSYSAVAALYALLQRPETFGLGILESPSMQIGNGQMLRDTANLIWSGHRVAVGVGTREGGFNENAVLHGYSIGELNRGCVRGVESLVKNLQTAVLPAQVWFVEEPGAGHKPDAWARRFPADLVFLFGRPEAVGP